MAEKPPNVGIDLTGDGNTASGNKLSGHDIGMRVSGSGNRIVGNSFIGRPSQPPPKPPKPSFWHHPLAKWVLGISATIIAGVILYYLGIK